ncbi:MAG: hypothetical protein HYW48_01690 [Deltaproteobacteria bacterium]|nr:hypothetical protein [Deltaproteobacteria bacterium]
MLPPADESDLDDKAQKILDCARQISQLEPGGIFRKVSLTPLSGLKIAGNVSFRVKKDGALQDPEAGKNILRFKKTDERNRENT